jgi:hypothetical protein
MSPEKLPTLRYQTRGKQRLIHPRTLAVILGILALAGIGAYLVFVFICARGISQMD